MVLGSKGIQYTPPKFSLASLPPKNCGFQDDPASYWVSVTFQWRLLLNFGRVTVSLAPEESRHGLLKNDREVS